MDIKIKAVSSSLVPNPTETGGSVNLSFDVYEYVPGEYKISVRRLCTRNLAPYTTRSGKYLLVPVKVPYVPVYLTSRTGNYYTTRSGKRFTTFVY